MNEAAPASATTSPHANNDLATLRTLVRELHLHYDVLPERDFGANGSRDVGVEIRLWAAHPHGARPNPGCHLCSELHSRVRSLASWAIAGASAALSWDILPYSPSLYWVPAEPTDEVCLVLRGMALDFAAGLDTAGQDECRRIRLRLEAAGVRQGSWSNRSARATS